MGTPPDQRDGMNVSNPISPIVRQRPHGTVNIRPECLSILWLCRLRIHMFERNVRK
jgi:hypothetical protein